MDERRAALSLADRGRLSLTLLGVILASTFMVATPSALAAQQVISSSGPLTNIYLNDNLACQVTYAGDASPEFYGGTNPGSCGTFIAVGGTAYGPRNTQYTLVSQSPVTGSGTVSSPYEVTTVVDAGTTGLRITQTDSYVVGDDAYRTDVRVSNSTGSAIAADLYHAADCYLQDSDAGHGFFDPSTGGIFCSVNPNNSPPARIEGFIPLSGGSHYIEDYYSTVWGAINGSQFPDTCECGIFQDNGAGLSWDVTVPAGGSITRSFLTSFSPVGRVPLTTSKAADSVSVPAGAASGYTITVSNPNQSAATLNSISDILPPGFSYTAGSTTGATPSDPAVSGQTLTWAEPFTVPAASGGNPGTLTLHFGVTVASTPGDYFNNAAATSSVFTVVPTGDSARITVTGQPPTTSIVSGPAGPTDSPTPTFTFSSRSGATFECSIDGGPFTACASPYTTPALSPGAHTLSVRARDASGVGPATVRSFTVTGGGGGSSGSGASGGGVITAASPSGPSPATTQTLPPPQLRESANAQQVRGVVLVRLPGTNRFVPLGDLRQIPFGAVLDARKGTVRLTTAANARGETQSAEFYEGVFRISQLPSGLTDLRLVGGNKSVCAAGRRGKRSALASKRRPRRSTRTVRRLWGNGSGEFRTSGSYSSAAVRGTTWLVADRCDGTLTRVTQGTVAVRDLVLRKTITLKAGRSYLAQRSASRARRR
jgi:uncharacterized repeat protein (TIGR01451 family)